MDGWNTKLACVICELNRRAESAEVDIPVLIRGHGSHFFFFQIDGS